MTYLGGERAVPHYNVMGVAKATLDSSVRYLAWDLGQKNIRVNAISAGPVRTLAARSIAGFPTMESIVEERSPLHRPIDSDDVGAAAAYLLSDEADNVTATHSAPPGFTGDERGPAPAEREHQHQQLDAGATPTSAEAADDRPHTMIFGQTARRLEPDAAPPAGPISLPHCRGPRARLGAYCLLGASRTRGSDSVALDSVAPAELPAVDLDVLVAPCSRWEVEEFLDGSRGGGLDCERVADPG